MKRGSMQRVLVYIVWADLEKGGTVNRKSPSAGIVADSPADTIEVVVTIPLTHTPVDPSDSEPANEEQDKTTTTSYLPLTSYTSSSDAIEEVLASLCLTEMIIDAVQQLAAFKLEQKISGYGRYYVNYQLQGDTYLLFFNKERVIRGILEVRSDGIVRNVKTNELDDINNYSDCKAYWFK